MYCPTCGAQAIDGANNCTACGKPLPRAIPPDNQLKSLEPVLPVNTSIWAIASGYLGLFSILLFPAPFALITGIIALRSLKRHPGVRGHVRAWLGIVLGSLCSILLLLLIFNMAASPTGRR